MPFWQLYFHLIWATKEREPLITPQVARKLYPFLVAKAGDMGVFVYALNGREDHGHLVVAIPPAVSVAEVVKMLKGSSSHMLNHPHEGDHFGWQRGYGALTVGLKQLPLAVEYVRAQQTHHAAGSLNGWLECATDHDEGPDATLRQTPVTVSLIKESGPEYFIAGEGLPAVGWD